MKCMWDQNNQVVVKSVALVLRRLRSGKPVAFSFSQPVNVFVLMVLANNMAS